MIILLVDSLNAVLRSACTAKVTAPSLRIGRIRLSNVIAERRRFGLLYLSPVTGDGCENMSVLFATAS
jgi:hypothetical protein